MKTLDEVIKALWCTNPEADPETKCNDCPYKESHINELWYVGPSCLDEMFTDVLYYLKILKAKNEEPPLGNPPDYISLDFHQLAEMIGEPVYIKDRGCKGHWEIITAVRKNLDGEDYTIRGNDRWQRIGDCIYRTKEGAHENIG